MVDCNGRLVTIFGGGEVGARKARYFSDEADVTVYSRSFSPAFQSIPVRQIHTELHAGDERIADFIRGAFLVIAATSDPALNTAILTQCREMKILCNNATNPQGDVVLPAKFTGERFTIAVSTRGGSPAVSRFIREHLESTWPNLDLMIILEEKLRHELKKLDFSEDNRRNILTAVLHDPVVWQTLTQGVPAALQYTEEKYLA